MLKHNTYFGGDVQSIGFERNAARASVGVMLIGLYRFDTAGAERMHVVVGTLRARIGGDDWQSYDAGSAFEVPANSYFDAEPQGGPVAYWCDFLA